VCAKNSAMDRFGHLRFELSAEFFIEFVGLVRSRCGDERGPVAFSRAGKQGKLTDDQEITRNLPHGKIHRSILIREDAKAGNLPGQPNDVISRICGFNAEKDQKPLADLTDDLLLNLHRGPSDALDNGAHKAVSVSVPVSDGHMPRGPT
jgi:RecB family exonuclease